MSSYYTDESVTLYHGDALDVLHELPSGSVNCAVTSPPYFGLRDYGTEGQYGLEASPAEYVETMRAVFAEVRRVLADDGTLWLNIGDSYSGNRGNSAEKPGADNKNKVVGGGTIGRFAGKSFLPDKNLMGIPWRVAFALQDDGWILRNDIIWAKPNGMPESVTDRLSAKHEHLFMFAKSPRYWFDLDAVREAHITSDRPLTIKTRGFTAYSGQGNHNDPGPDGLGRGVAGKNPGDVWSIPTQPFSAAHFAVMPQALASRAIQAGCKPGGTVLDPFSGSSTTGLAAAKHGRKYVGIDLSAEYLDLSLRTRLAQTALFDDEATA